MISSFQGEEVPGYVYGIIIVMVSICLYCCYCCILGAVAKCLGRENPRIRYLVIV